MSSSRPSREEPAPETERARPDPRDEDVVVGRIVGAWGIRGEVKVRSHTDNPDRLSAGKAICVEGGPALIERSTRAKAGLRLKLNVAADRGQAEALRGAMLTVPRSQIPPPPDGAYYHFQIIGIDVLSEDGQPLGQVREILTTGSNDVYVVERPNRKDLLLPAIPDVVLDVDTAENKITARVPDGLE